MAIQPSEQQLREAARACFINARELYDDAVLLQKNQRAASAAALAVIGLEEFGKAIVYLVAALAPDQRSALPPKLDGHEMKHRVCDLAEGAECMNEDGWAVDRQNGFAPSAEDKLVDMAVLLVDWGITDLTDGRTARQEFADRRRKHREDPAGDIYIALREPDLKNAALYVDLDPEGRLLTPDRIEDRAASLAIAGLEYYLGVYSALPDAASGETAWESFASRVRGRRPAA